MIARKIQALYNLLLISLFIGLLSAPAIKMIGSEKMVFSYARNEPWPPFHHSLSRSTSWIYIFPILEPSLMTTLAFENYLFIDIKEKQENDLA